MDRYCIIGDPVAYSLSPQIHNAAFKALGIDAVFEKAEVKSDALLSSIARSRSDLQSQILARPARSRCALAEFMHAYRTAYAGGSVTIPHKEAVMRFLDEIDDEAAAIGAVNTIVNRNGRLFGYNTDAYGAMAALQESGVPALRGQVSSVIILGAGGAARAITYGCLVAGADITILNRTVDKAEKLADYFNQLRKDRDIETFDIVKYGALSAFNPEHCDVLINTTSCGMAPNDSQSPIDLSAARSEISIAPQSGVVMDIIYYPLKTKLLRDASALGYKIITGDRMFLHQAAKAFELWTGKKAPIEVMQKAFVMHLNHQRKNSDPETSSGKGISSGSASP